MSSDKLAILQIIIPLLSAPAVILFRGRSLPWAVTIVASTIAFVIALLLTAEVSATGTIITTLGGWVAPWGIEYRIDLMGALILLIVTGISSVVLWTARLSIDQEIDESRQPLFYSAWLLCLAGLLGIAVTGDAFNLFVFLEISSLSSYALIAMGRDRRALTASFQYLIMGTIGATFILIGVGFLYMATGTLNMADLASRIPELGDSRTVRSAFAFIFVGIGLKVAMFPLHLWLPNAYAYAPSVVSAFLAATATKVAVYALLRFIYSVFGFEFSLEAMPLSLILIALAVTAMLVASTVAIFQNNLKRMLAYSSVAQIGYMLLGIGLANATGLTATLLHLFNHALMKGALFLALAAVCYRLGSPTIEKMAGLGRVMPWTMAAFVIGGLSIIGVPLTVGFVSKWYLILATLENGWWPLTVVILIASLMAVIYIWRVVEVAYMRPRPDGAAEVREAPLGLLLPAWLLVVANLYFGIQAKTTFGIAESAATTLLWGAP